MDPWYKVATLRKEVREGRSFSPDEFAIALEQVVAGTAPADYRDPAQFFARTCFTRALKEHAGMALRRLAAPGTIARIVEAERDGCDAVVIDCMGDPGMMPGRECVSIPVVGPCEAAMHVASMLGHTFSVVTVLARLRPQFERQAQLYGVREKLASVRAVSIPVLDLEKDLERTKAALADEAVRAVEEDGADAIVFGCTGMLGFAGAVRRGLLARGHDVPVVDPIPWAVRLATSLVDAGLRHSKITYDRPPSKPVVGYDIAPPAPPVRAAAE